MNLCMYCEIYLHHRFYLFRSLVKTISVAEVRISTTSTDVLNGCLNFRGMFTTKIIKSNVKPHVKSDAQKVNYVHLPLLPLVMAVI